MEDSPIGASSRESSNGLVVLEFPMAESTQAKRQFVPVFGLLSREKFDDCFAYACSVPARHDQAMSSHYGDRVSKFLGNPRWRANKKFEALFARATIRASQHQNPLASIRGVNKCD